MNVLIAHADASVRQGLRDLLERQGYEVTEAADAEQVDAECSGAAPDVTLLHGELSRRSKTSLITRIKSHREAFFTAIIIIEREVELDAAISEMRNGAYDYLLEPLRPAEVVARVQAAARTKSLQEELLSQSRRLESLIFEDSLTQLYNRRFMFSQLPSLVSGARRHERPLSVVMIDVDHFKSLNDRFGHDVGDRVLVTAARAMRGRLRAEDYLGRLGGEEFLALLPDVDEEGAAAVAESLRQCVAEAGVDAGDEHVQITVSAGWATWGGETPQELLKRADEAMYRAKAAGRDTVARG